MTRKSVRDYAQAMQRRYLEAMKSERGRLLDEFCQTTGYHRKAASRVVHQVSGGVSPRRGRPRDVQ